MKGMLLRYETGNQDDKIAACFKFFANTIFKILGKDTDYFVAGGALRDWFSDRKCSDFDVFFKKEEDYKAVKKELEEVTGKLAFVKLIHSNDNSDRYRFEDGPLGFDVDLVKKRYFANAADIIDNFDFTVACAVITPAELSMTDRFLMDLCNKRLAINALPAPLGTQLRLAKYIRKGFVPCVGTLTEIAVGIRNMPEADFLNRKETQYFD